VLVFDNQLYDPMGPVRLGEGRSSIVQRLSMVDASGGTALYEATSRAYELALERAKKDPKRIHAVVVMTDGAQGAAAMAGRCRTMGFAEASLTLLPFVDWTTAGRGFSTTWTAPPPRTAPPQAQAHSFARAILTDIGPLTSREADGISPGAIACFNT